MNRMRSFLMPTLLGTFALVVGGMTIDLHAQRGGGGVGQGRPANPGPANPGGGGRPGGSGGGNPNAGGGGNPNAGGGGGNSGNPHAGGGGRNGGNPNAGGGNNGNPNKGGGNARGGKPEDAGRGGRGRGNAATKPTDGGKEPEEGDAAGRGRGNAANGPRDAQGFKNYGQFVAAQHVSENLGIDFDKLKGLMTGDNPKSLGQAIQELRPDVDANAEATKAQKQADTDEKAPQ